MEPTQQKSSKKMWVIVLVVIAVLAVYLVSSYNGFVAMNEKVTNS